MPRPIIGISSGVVYNLYFPNLPPVHGQRHTFVDAVVRAGGIPILLPLAQDESAVKEMFKLVDGLLLSSGNDINPKMYGEESTGKLEDVSDLRDKVDKQFLGLALEKEIPILAICRGMQLINIYAGGTLYQDIPSELPGSRDHMSSVDNLEENAHPIHIDTDSKLHEILGEQELFVNSVHHQAVKKVGKNLNVSAKSDDGIIEAVEAVDDRFIIGIQGHPESLGRIAPGWEKLFQAFVKESAKAHQRSVK